MEEENKINNPYGASQIQVLEGVEHVRRRPGMYIGSTSEVGLHHLVYEVLDNSVDEHLAGHGKRIIITLEIDGSVTVQDFGRGIPIEVHPKTKKSTLETVMTTLGAGGKFGEGGYSMSGGLHGVGVSVVNALSEWCIAKVYRNGNLYYQKYMKGIAISDIKSQPLTKNIDRIGTTIQFLPDKTIFLDTTEYKFDILQKRLREMAFLNKGLKIELIDKQTNKSEVYHYEGGVASYVDFLTTGKKPIHPIISISESEVDKKNAKNLIVDIALQYNIQYDETILGFANNIYTIDGGTHVVGFKNALSKLFRTQIPKMLLDNPETEKGLKKKLETEIVADDIKEGLVAIISVKMTDPEFEGQTKSKLTNSKIKNKIDDITSKALLKYFGDNLPIARKIMLKIVDAAQARLASREAKELSRQKSTLLGDTGLLASSLLPGKLTDCTNKNVADREIFIVEGQSAGGCHAGETEVLLADGRKLSFIELEKEYAQGKENFVYTYNHSTNKIDIEKIANCWKTKNTNELVKITLDNNEELICTRDHPYMLRDGTYIPAEQLKSGDSLMPLYIERYMTSEYIMKFDPSIVKQRFDDVILHPNGQKELVYHAADRWNLKNNIYSVIPDYPNHRHHIDEDVFNNSPNNIIRLTRKDHLALHVNRGAIRESEEFKAFYRDRQLKYFENLENREKYRQTTLKQWENEEYRKLMSDNTKKQMADPEQKEIRRVAAEKHWTDDKRQERSALVKQYNKDHPEILEDKRKATSDKWKDPEYRANQLLKRKAQFTEENVLKYKKIRQKNKILRALELMNEVGIEKYPVVAKEKNSRLYYTISTILKLMTYFEEYNTILTKEDLVNSNLYTFNHSVVKVEFINEYKDVYDIEVPNTHNFALAAGIFVHNSARQGRNRESQAVLPLKGKILNIEKAKDNKIYENEEIKSLLLSLGILKATSEDDNNKLSKDIYERNFDFSAIRYSRIIIMCDSDADGGHIRILLLTFLYRFARELIEKGYIYIAQPPLYKVEKNKKSQYLLNDRALEEYKAIHGNDGYALSRFKGLGEMMPQQLWDTTLDPDKRILLKVNLNDAAEAEATFQVLMGGTPSNLEARKKFIAANAIYANIDA